MKIAEMSFEQLRQDLPVTEEMAYFQTGSHGPTPDSVLRVINENMVFQSQFGSASPETARLLIEREQQVKGLLAEFLNVRSDELAWTPNTTQAMQRILRNINWRRGDEFVVSSAEHVSTRGACLALEKYFGVVIKTIPADQGDDVLLEELSAALTARTRLVCLSQVTTVDGRRLPIAEAAPIGRKWGVPLMVDVAQSLGQYPVDVARLGCDFLVGSGHKWLLGPMGLGFLWVASERIPDFRPDFTPDVSPWHKPGDPQPPIALASRIERGTQNHAIPIGLGRALKVMNALDLDQIEAHVRQLVKMVFQEIGQWKGVQILTPTEPGRASGLLSVVFDGYDEPRTRDLVRKLLEERIVVKFQPECTAMRISVACFNNADEVQRLLETLKSLLFL
jgi:selenocysteine lyase/cysteine desulfurase